MELLAEPSSRPDAETVMEMAEKTVTISDECTTTPRCVRPAPPSSLRPFPHAHPQRSPGISNNLGFLESRTH